MYMSQLTKQAVSSWDAPIVSTSGGKVRGVQKEDGFIFRSIPYGRAERFEDPVSTEDDGTLFLADHYTCSSPELLTPLPPNQHLEPHFFLPQDEDCLNVTVWTPILAPEKPMPVLVWLGAGDWERGGANELFASDGENLSSYGNLVVVSVNHRLNVLGTLRLTERTACRLGGENTSAQKDRNICGLKEKNTCDRKESPGLLDLILALKWVRNNSEAFGGDADNVTLFGQAGGGQKILDLMCAPAADGLYHKAVISGMEVPFQQSEEEIDRMTGLILKQVGTGNSKTIPYWFLAEHVLDALEEYKKMTGKDYVWGVMTGQGFKDAAVNVVGVMDGRGTAKATEVPEETLWAKTIPMLVSTGGKAPEQVQRFVQRKKQEGSPVWLYEFSFVSPLYSADALKDGAERVRNGAELPFWFHNADYLESSYVPGVTERLQDKMAKALADFAGTGIFRMEEDEVPLDDGE